jgi:ABC-type Mn2+/Zn2+ transport system ATPase subunit
MSGARKRPQPAQFASTELSESAVRTRAVHSNGRRFAAMTSRAKEMFILAGPNGAGKTTFARRSGF